MRKRMQVFFRVTGWFPSLWSCRRTLELQWIQKCVQVTRTWWLISVETTFISSMGESTKESPILVSHVVSGQSSVLRTNLVVVGSNGQDLKKSAGTPSFIIQEEFDRYSGIWWAPGDASGEFCLPVIPLSLSVLIPEPCFSVGEALFTF